MWRHATMVAKFLDHNSTELNQRRQRRRRERQKKQEVYIYKKTTLHVHHPFFTFLSRRCTTATWNLLISRTGLKKYVNTTQKFPFSFSKLRYGPFGFNPRKYREHCWQIKWWWIRSMKFWNSTNSLFEWRFRFVVIQKFYCHDNVA